MTCEEVLKTVEQAVLADRRTTYGAAEDSFADVAAIASIVLRKKLAAPLDAADVAAFMAALKLARIATTPTHLDSWVDLAGYAVCGASLI